MRTKPKLMWSEITKLLIWEQNRI